MKNFLCLAIFAFALANTWGELSAADDISVLQQKADQGDADAQFILGLRYEKGAGVPQDNHQMEKWLRLAAEQGHAEAQHNLGIRYFFGNGVPQDYDEAAKWYRMAAEQGHAEAQLNLGVLYNMEGVAHNDQEAVSWFRLAAEQGLAPAQSNLGHMYADGNGIPQDYQEAAKWYRLAAEQGDALAQDSLGEMYTFGLGVTQDHNEAVKWYRLAAEQGYVGAQVSLGLLHDNTLGEGIPQNYQEVAKWYRLAAEQGNPLALSTLGGMYVRGEGVPQDYQEAAKWYHLAAEQGHANAQAMLGVMYASGEGVPQDYVQAHLWFNLAATQGEDDARSRRDIIQRMMTADQLAEAQRLARDWQPGQGSRETEPTARDSFSSAPSIPPTTEPDATGTGFSISIAGQILTSAHVVNGCQRVNLAQDGRKVRVVAIDSANDLALLETGTTAKKVATLAVGRGPRLGETVTVAGFPLRGMIGSGLNVTVGTISALSGPGDDARLLQFTAPVQPGNSGGPLLDAAGRVVGIVAAKLDALTAAKVSGALPENVNFAVRSSVVAAFLESRGVEYSSSTESKPLTGEIVVNQAQLFTVAIECYR